MARNATGTFTLVSGNPVTTGGMLAPLRGLAGTANSPAHSFTNFPTVGLYAVSRDDARVSVDGVDRMRWRADNATTQTWDDDLGVWEDINTVATVVGDNTLLNGAFEIWPYATSVENPAGDEYITAARWRFRRGGNATGMRSAQYESQQPAGSRYGALVDRVDTDANTDTMLAGYQMPSAEVYPLQGQAVTLTLGVRFGTQFSGDDINLLVTTGTGIDEAISLSGVAFPTGNSERVNDSTLFDVGDSSGTQTVSVTFTVPVDASELAFRLSWIPEGVYSSDGGIDGVILFTAKLETGTSATPFKRQGSSVDAERALCEAFYAESSQRYDAAPTVNSTTVLSRAGTVELPTTMRVDPLVAVLNEVGFVATPNVLSIRTTGFRFAEDALTDITETYIFGYTADAEIPTG